MTHDEKINEVKRLCNDMFKICQDDDGRHAMAGYIGFLEGHIYMMISRNENETDYFLDRLKKSLTPCSE
jgi:hypothetical protein